MKRFVLKCLLGSAMAQSDYWCYNENLEEWTSTSMQTLETTEVAAGTATDCKVLIEGWVEANGAGLYVCGEYFYDGYERVDYCNAYAEISNEDELREYVDPWGVYSYHEAWAWDDLVELDDYYEDQSSATGLTATVLTAASIAMASTI